jgi:lysophospholipid acyltransferase (LPLAT)-like uncharacterized protein
MARLLKRILKSGLIQKLVCWLGSLYIRLVAVTCCWDVIRGDIPTTFWDKGEPFLLCFWHGRILLMHKCWKKSLPIHMLISQHRDGQLISRTASHIGVSTVTGSSNRGGAQAIRNMLKIFRKGECIGITPDGPRGPRMRASDGVINFARLANATIIPATYSVSNRKIIGSWDRFIIPRPFSKGAIVWGQPIHVPKNVKPEEIEKYRQIIEDELNTICVEADIHCGQSPIEPAAPALSTSEIQPL